MKEQVYNDVKELLKQLAEGLGTTVEYLWPIMIQREIAFALGWLIVGAICSICIVWLTVMLWRKEQKGTFDTDCVAPTLATILGAILIIAYAVHIPAIIARLVAPEYYAIMGLLEKL